MKYPYELNADFTLLQTNVILYASIELKISPFYVENGCTPLICLSMQWSPLVTTLSPQLNCFELLEKHAWLMQIEAFCIDSQDSGHEIPAVIGTIGVAIWSTTASQTILVISAKTLTSSLSHCIDRYWFAKETQQLRHIHHPRLNRD